MACKVSVIKASEKHITCKMEHGHLMCGFYVSVVYGHNSAGDRKALWDEMRELHGYIAAEAWILTGDFNSVRWDNERSDKECFYANAAATSMLVLGKWSCMT